MKMTPGKIYGIEGCNGSGKTMLMRVIAGLIFPTKGQVYIHDAPLGAASEYPVTLGILIENPAFLNSYYGFDNLKILASIRQKIGAETIRQCLADVGLDPDDRRKYRKYSLGMKQRLGIASAILEQPDILILDEPVNALDQDGVALVRELILREKARGALVILSCHDHGFLESVSDEMYHMNEGRCRTEVLGHEKKLKNISLGCLCWRFVSASA